MTGVQTCALPILQTIFVGNLDYFKTLDRKFFRRCESEVRNNFYGLQVIQNLASRYQQEELLKEIEAEFQRQQQIYGVTGQ